MGIAEAGLGCSGGGLRNSRCESRAKMMKRNEAAEKTEKHIGVDMGAGLPVFF